jgi:23S rRNA (cytosine1962-C5)-methyltransferase
MTFHEHLMNIPPANARRLALHVKPAAERALKAGHPWLFEDAITDANYTGAAAGTLAVVFDYRDRFLGVGLYDPHSPIRVRVLQHHTPAQINRDWFAGVLQAAAARRAGLGAALTTGYRLVYGANDGLPALIVDRYAGTLVMKLYSAAWLPHLGDLLPVLVDTVGAERLVLRLSRQVAEGETFGLWDGQTLYGPPPEGPIRFRENGLWFAADVLDGHKTGFFFDQRENRSRVGELAAGKAEVLDVFAYTGGFSVYAAAGGAAHVTSLDISGPALAAARHNMALNADHPNVTAATHDMLAADAFEAMAGMAGEGRRFDMVIVDPPAFAKQASEADGALRAYRRLAGLATELLRPGGQLVMASCSSRVTADDFFRTVQQASAYPLREIERTGHALDHPVTFAEGVYLKCLFAVTAP